MLQRKTNQKSYWTVYHITKLVHAQSEGVFAHRVLKVVQLNFPQVLLPNRSSPARFFLRTKADVADIEKEVPYKDCQDVAFQLRWKWICVWLQTLYYPPHDSFFHASSSRGASDHLTAGLSLEQQTLHSSIAWGERPTTSSCLEDCDRGKQDAIGRNVTEVTLRLQYYMFK